MCILVKHACLKNWRNRREDKKTELHWNKIAAERELTSYEKYQQEWNFIESKYNHTPSNNGLDLVSPGFAFTTDLAKFIVIVDVILPCKNPTMDCAHNLIEKAGGK